MSRPFPVSLIAPSLVLLATLGACTDGSVPLHPPAAGPAPDPVALQVLLCTADVRANAVTCGGGAPSNTSPGGGEARIILTPPAYVELSGSNATHANGIFTVDVTVRNLSPQTLSAAASGAYDGAGVRVFFSQLPTALAGTGTITVNGAETGKFTRGGQLFYRYPQPLPPGATSRPRTWSFSVPPTVISFTFSVLVAASVPLPQGWIEISGAPVLQVAPGGTLALAAVVRDAMGRDITSTTPVTWALADSSVATIAGSSLSAAPGVGRTTVFATAASRSASAQLRVGLQLVQVAAGRRHTCGLTPEGLAYCWGLNGSGQLGDSTTTPRLVPTPVRQGGQRYVELAAGGDHTCGRTSAGQMFCWGAGASGQLGDDGTAPRRVTPVAVRQPGIRFVAITAGDQHTCGVSSFGRGYCWGRNQYGEVGDRTTTVRTTPVELPVELTTITAGDRHTCGRGPVLTFCWGDNRMGQLGDKTRGERHTPVQVRTGAIRPSKFTAGGSHSCGANPTGRTICWGGNSSGQLGDGTTTERIVPVTVPGVTSAEISAGSLHTCARSFTGQAYCWGGNTSGQLGIGSGVPMSTVPLAVQQGSATYVQLTAGADHACGRSSIGQVYCWGNNGDGQLGDNSLVDRRAPVMVDQTSP